jgi:hypothetical protein
VVVEWICRETSRFRVVERMEGRVGSVRGLWDSWWRRYGRARAGAEVDGIVVVILSAYTVASSPAKDSSASSVVGRL